MGDPHMRIANHELRVAAGELRAAIRRLDPDLLQEANATEPRLSLDRAAATADWVEGLLDIVDPLLVGPAALDPMVAPLRDAARHVDQVPGNVAVVGTVAALLDQVFAQAGPLVVATPAVRETASQVARGFGISLGHRTRALTDEIATAERELADLRSAIQQAREASDAEAATRISELTGRLEAIGASADGHAQRVSSLVDRVDDEFAAAQRARDDEFRQAESQRAERFDVTSAAAEERVETLVATLEADARSGLARVETVRAKVDDLYEIIAKEGTAGAFHDEAKVERRAANTWRRVAVVLGLLAIATAFLGAFVIRVSDESWPHLVAKLAVTVGIGTVAAYAGTQSARHRHREEAAKQLELDLTAIGPFLEEISEEGGKRDDVRAEFVRRWMAIRTEPTKVESEKVVGVPVKALIEALVQQNGRS